MPWGWITDTLRCEDVHIIRTTRDEEDEKAHKQHLL